MQNSTYVLHGSVSQVFKKGLADIRKGEAAKPPPFPPQPIFVGLHISKIGVKQPWRRGGGTDLPAPDFLCSTQA